MHLFYVLILLLITATACFGLSRTIASRILGIFAAAASLIGGVLLFVPLEEAGPTLHMLQLDQVALAIPAALPAATAPLAAVALIAGAGSLFNLAIALPAKIRDFGSIFGWILLGLAAVPPGLAVDPDSPLLAACWSLAALAGYAAYRASGALHETDRFPLGISMGLLSGIVLLGGLFGGGPFAALCLIGAAMILAGAAPFQLTNREALSVPAPLGALFYGIIMPTLGMGFLLETSRNLPAPPATWGTALLMVGSLGAWACAAGMPGERGLRRILGWSAGMQASTILAAIGLAGLDRPAGELAVRALLANLAFSSVAGAAVATTLEQTTGSDDYSQLPKTRLWAAGTLWALAGAASIGLPPLWGFWGRYWLFEGASTNAPWAMPLLISSGLLALPALLVPLGGLWYSGPRRSEPSSAHLGGPAGGLLAGLILITAGLWPRAFLWLWPGYRAAQHLPIAPAAYSASLIGGSVSILLLLIIWRGRWSRQSRIDPELEPVIMAPESLGAHLAFLAAAGRPDRLAGMIWRGISWLSRQLQVVIGVFEQRYYLLGILLALLSIMLLMAQ